MNRLKKLKDQLHKICKYKQNGYILKIPFARFRGCSCGLVVAVEALVVVVVVVLAVVVGMVVNDVSALFM